MKLIYFQLIIVCSVFFSCAKTDDPKLAFEHGDYELSFRLWKERAGAGDAEAQNYLGIQYFLGLGVKRDYRQALIWYEKSATQGYADAQRNYGDLFHYGYGVPQDYYAAYVWYFAASQQGHDKAKRHMDDLAGSAKLTPNQQMHAKLAANAYIVDPALRFMSHDTYIEEK